MSTRSLNIIKKNNKLLIFWMHWDGYSAADVILNWSDKERKYALGLIRKEKHSVSHIMTDYGVKRRIKDTMTRLTKSILSCRQDNDYIEYLIGRLKEANLVNLNSGEYDSPELGVYECDADRFGEFTTVNQVLARIFELTHHRFISEIQIGNVIDFDAQVCRFEYDFDNWSKKKNAYIEHHVSFAKAFPIAKVKKYGAEYTMGHRDYKH